SRDGLSTLVFLLPLLAIFGLFSWFPIVRAFVMSLQETNLVSIPTFVGLENFARVLADPVFGIAVRNTAYFALLALVIGFPTLILQLIATAQVFTEPFLFTGGGPANSTTTVLLLIYHYAFQNSLGGEYGMAAALSIMLAAFLGIFTAGYFWLTRSWNTSS